MHLLKYSPFTYVRASSNKRFVNLNVPSTPVPLTVPLANNAAVGPPLWIISNQALCLSLCHLEEALYLPTLRDLFDCQLNSLSLALSLSLSLSEGYTFYWVLL